MRAVDEEDCGVGEEEAVGHGLAAVGEGVRWCPGWGGRIRVDCVAVAESDGVGHVARGAAADENCRCVGWADEGKKERGGGGWESTWLEGGVREGFH